MRRARWVLGAVLLLVPLSLPASADVSAVAEPETQTVAINGARGPG